MKQWKNALGLVLNGQDKWQHQVSVNLNAKSDWRLTIKRRLIPKISSCCETALSSLLHHKIVTVPEYLWGVFGEIVNAQTKHAVLCSKQRPV
ncbi:hypothetical protein [Ferrimonas aestuarii]|uniref:Uncharacterized protein n=1 Tax=Ferrimonas aestuarii TaxID=2569539 RepID=A0A4U1BRF1_9GAMM|nr:hypothetical protein [Ferrimonas aestuarii]TKB57424.1 hypothetical protein FCL42_03885 [Ferrimonas aestuarii]